MLAADAAAASISLPAMVRVGSARRSRFSCPAGCYFASGEFRGADGHPDVAVGVDAPPGLQLLVFDGKRGNFATPMRFSLPGSATSIEVRIARSDPYLDLAVAAGGRLSIVHGWGCAHSPALGTRIERLAAAAGVRALSIAYFMRDRDGRNEIAAAFSTAPFAC